MLRTVGTIFLVVGILCAGWGVLTTGASLVTSADSTSASNWLNVGIMKILIDVGIFGGVPIAVGVSLRSMAAKSSSENHNDEAQQ